MYIRRFIRSLVRFCLFPFAALRFLPLPPSPFYVLSFFYCSLAVYYILAFLFFCFCFLPFIFYIFRYIPPPLFAPMVLNSPHSYIFLPCFMKRIHTEDLIFKKNRQAIPHQSKKSVKQIGAQKHLWKQEKAHARKQKIRHTKQETMHPTPPIGAFFCLPIETEKALFHSHILRIYRKSKRKISHFRLFFTIFLCRKSFFFVLVRIFYNKNIQKHKKTGHKSPEKA